MLVNAERTHTSAPQPSVAMHGEKTEGEEGRTEDKRRQERTRREGARRRKGSETGPTTTRLPSATDSERQGGKLAPQVAALVASLEPKAFGCICTASTPTDKENEKKKERLSGGMGTTTVSIEEVQAQEGKEEREESILALLGIIGTFLNLFVIVFVYIYTTL
ncbi:hypothetical protein E1301_Tti002804 [Triplophysa tibetana]|uniref:Uncharacterized protein n=1 Tax=Triplophysa tibetana TaxID=1572043 RepID=A0A5A9NNP1_9TELE|nr:hypothetical protein E1301_Tti002804 [Triplophysa tibetana]